MAAQGTSPSSWEVGRQLSGTSWLLNTLSSQKELLLLHAIINYSLILVFNSVIFVSVSLVDPTPAKVLNFR